MNEALAAVVDRCKRALQAADPQAEIEAILDDASRDAAIRTAIASRTKFASLEDLAIHRSEELTVLAGALPPGFAAGPHNHNLWSVVSVCAGQEDNEFFVRDDAGLRNVGHQSIVAPGVLANDKDVIHAIRNPLDEPLVALHAYGGDLFATPRSSWDPDTHEEIGFDWRKTSSTGS